MSPRSIAAIAALVVGLVTLGLSLRCGAENQLVIGSLLTGMLAAIWSDNPERSVGDRIAKFVLLIFMVGGAVFFFALILNANRCT
jgi:hypothetical protein